MHGLSMNSHPGRWYIVENSPSPRFFYSFSMIIPFWATSSLPLSFSLKFFLMLATVHMITFQLLLSLERCLVFYQSTEKINVYDDMLELWFTQDAEHYLVLVLWFMCYIYYIFSFSSVHPLISPGNNTGCIIMYQDNPMRNDDSKLKLACHVW